MQIGDKQTRIMGPLSTATDPHPSPWASPSPNPLPLGLSLTHSGMRPLSIATLTNPHVDPPGEGSAPGAGALIPPPAVGEKDDHQRGRTLIQPFHRTRSRKRRNKFHPHRQPTTTSLLAHTHTHTHTSTNSLPHPARRTRSKASPSAATKRAVRSMTVRCVGSAGGATRS